MRRPRHPLPPVARNSWDSCPRDSLPPPPNFACKASTSRITLRLMARKLVNFRLDPELNEAIGPAAKAAGFGKNKSAFVRQAIRREIALTHGPKPAQQAVSRPQPVSDRYRELLNR